MREEDLEAAVDELAAEEMAPEDAEQAPEGAAEEPAGGEADAGPDGEPGTVEG
jgi:hypothetical protein